MYERTTTLNLMSPENAEMGSGLGGLDNQICPVKSY